MMLKKSTLSSHSVLVIAMLIFGWKYHAMPLATSTNWWDTTNAASSSNNKMICLWTSFDKILVTVYHALLTLSAMVITAGKQVVGLEMVCWCDGWGYEWAGMQTLSSAIATVFPFEFYSQGCNQHGCNESGIPYLGNMDDFKYGSWHKV